MKTQKQVKTFASDSPLGKNRREITGWTIQDKLEEIQAKTKIKEGHCEWFAEKAQAKALEKKKEIHEKRKEIKALRLDTHDALHPHPRVISDAMRYDRGKHCALAKRLVPDAIEWVDLESIDMERACDELIYVRQKREEKLEEAQQKLALLTSVVEEEKCKHAKLELRKIQYLQNEIQKQVTKEDTAFFVMKQYLAIAEILEKDMIYFETILEELGNDIKMQNEEITSFTEIQREEEIAKRETQKQYKQAELAAADKAAEPERKLMMLKLEATSFIQYEMTSKRSIPEFMETEGIDEAEKTVLKTRDMLSMYENSYKLLKDAMMATDIKQISVVLMAQEWTKEHLSQEIEKHKAKISSQMTEFELLEETYLEIVDALDERKKEMKKLEQETINDIKNRDEAMDKTQISLNVLGNLLAKLKCDLNRLLMEFEESELVIPEGGAEDMFGDEDLLKQCQKKIQYLINDIKDLIEHLQDSEEKVTFHEFLDTQQANNSVNKRFVNYPVTQVVQKPLTLHDTEEDEDNMIRAMIKKTAEKLSRKMKIKFKKQRTFL